MVQNTKKFLIQILLIITILLCSLAHVLPWGKIDADPFWTIDIYHWSGISASYSGEAPVFEVIFPWTNFTTENSTINTYLYAGSSLLLYLMIPLSIASIGLGLIALIRLSPKKKKRIMQAGITSTITIIFAALYIIFGILPRMEAQLSNISEAFHWTTGFYLMIITATLYFITFILIKKYPDVVSTNTPSNKLKTKK
jgi:hypothetical protein